MAPPPTHGYAARWRLWATCVGDHHKDRRPNLAGTPPPSVTVTRSWTSSGNCPQGSASAMTRPRSSRQGLALHNPPMLYALGLAMN